MRPTNTEHVDDENDASDSENEDENDDAQGDARESHDDAHQSQDQQNNAQNAQRQGDDNAQNDTQDARVDADDASGSESDTDTSDEESDDEPVYIVEKILRHKYVRGVRHYRIKWAGFSARHNSWEPERNLPKELIKVSGATARWPFTDSAVPSSLLLLRSAGLQPADLLLILLFLPYYYCYYYYYYQSIGAIIIIIKHLVCEILKDIVRTKIFAMCAYYVKVML